MDARILDLIRSAAPKGAVPPGADQSARSVSLPFAALLGGRIPPAAAEGSDLDPSRRIPPAAKSGSGISLFIPVAEGLSETHDLQAAVVEPARPPSVTQTVPTDHPLAELVDDIAPAPGSGQTSRQTDGPTAAPPIAVAPAAAPAPASVGDLAAVGNHPTGGEPVAANSESRSPAAEAIYPQSHRPIPVRNAAPEAATRNPIQATPEPVPSGTAPAIDEPGSAQAETWPPAPSTLAPSTPAPAIAAAAVLDGPARISANEAKRAASRTTPSPTAPSPTALSPKAASQRVAALDASPTATDPTAVAPHARPAVAQSTAAAPAVRPPAAAADDHGFSSRPGVARTKVPTDVEAAAAKPATADDAPRSPAATSDPSSPKTGWTPPSGLVPATAVALPDGQQTAFTVPNTIQADPAIDAPGGGKLDAAGRHAMTLPQRTATEAAVGIRRAVADGRERISLKLHPAELGRIDVRIEIAEDGAIRAVIAAEKAETLDLMQRDARSLERALQNAGLKTDSGSLSFDQGAGGQDARADVGDERNESRSEPAGPEAGSEAPTAAAARSSHHGLVDLSV